MTTESEIRTNITFSKVMHLELQTAAAGQGVTTSALIRALLAYGLDHLEDPQLDDIITTTRTAERERRQRAAKAAKQTKDRMRGTKDGPVSQG